MSMTVEVSIPDELQARLEQKAKIAGLDSEQYLRELISKDLSGPQSFDEMLSGFREEVHSSGMSDGELNELFAAARLEAATERKNTSFQ